LDIEEIVNRLEKLSLMGPQETREILEALRGSILFKTEDIIFQGAPIAEQHWLLGVETLNIAIRHFKLAELHLK